VVATNGTNGAVEVDGLVKQFGDFTAVDGISFSVEPGELFGFLGPNGAGKTTTISVLCTLLHPTGGLARVAGHDVVRARNEVRSNIGLVFQEVTLDDYLTGEENLRFHAVLYGLHGSEIKRRMDPLLEMVGLTDWASQQARFYSGGMKRRLEIARGLLHTPRILFLDEPTIGLDPVGARELRSTIASLTAAGKTVLLTTHYMFEADALCDRIAVISKGEIVAEGTPADLKRGVDQGSVLEVEVYGVDEKTIERLRRLHGVLAVAVEEREQAQVLVVQTETEAELTSSILGHLNGGQIGRISQREPTLEDAYVALVTEE
jgi:ABC-2 type transport system ATP-binding protein